MKYLGNKLDLLLRNCQDGQTNGIPVGPDTSLLMAEILLAKADRALTRKRTTGIRYMDDYELVFDTEKQALEGRSQLQEELLELELDLGTAKTSVQSLPQQLEDSWVSALNMFELYEDSSFFTKQLIRFFDLAFELARQFPNDGVLKYAAGRIVKLTPEGDAVKLIEHLLMQCAQVEAGALSFVLASMLRNAAMDSSTQKRRHRMLLRIIENHAPLRHSSEVAWAVWACIAMKLRLPKAATRAVMQMEDSICCLLALHARELKLLESPDELKPLREVKDAHALYGPRWLLSYEANIKGWFRFTGAADYVAKDPNFALLKRAGVSFYDESKTVLPSSDSESMEARRVKVDDYLSRIVIRYGEDENFSNAEFE
jgi:hypothetical protein